MIARSMAEMYIRESLCERGIAPTAGREAARLVALIYGVLGPFGD